MFTNGYLAGLPNRLHNMPSFPCDVDYPGDLIFRSTDNQFVQYLKFVVLQQQQKQCLLVPSKLG